MTYRHLTGLAAAVAIAMTGLTAAPAQAENDTRRIIFGPVAPVIHGSRTAPRDRHVGRWQNGWHDHPYQPPYTAPRDRNTGPVPFLKTHRYKGYGRWYRRGHGDRDNGWRW